MLLLAAVIGQDAVGQEMARLSLDQCIRTAIQSHPAVKASRAGYFSAADQTAIAKSYLAPDVQAQVNYTFIDEPRSVDVNLFEGQLGDRLVEAASFFEIARQAGGAVAVASLDDLNGPLFTQTKQAVAAGLPQTIRADLLGRNFVTSQIRLVQPLWTHGKLTGRVQQAQAGAGIAEASVRKTENEIAFSVSRAYMTVLLSEELQNVATRASGYAEGIESLAQAQVDAGDDFVTAADVLRARTMRSLYEEQVVGLRVARERALAGLKLATGLPQGSNFDVAEQSLPTGRIAASLEALRQQAFAERPELRQATLAVRVANLGRGISHAEYFPNVAGFASFNTINDDANFPNPNDPTEWALGVTATMPIFSGGRRVSQVRQAGHLESQAVEQRRLLAQVVDQEVQDAYLELNEQAGRMDEAAAAVTSAESAQEAFRAQFRLGRVSAEATPQYYEDRLTTLLLLVTAQTRYYQALFGYNVAAAKLTLVTAGNPLAPHDIAPNDETAAVRGPAPGGPSNVGSQRSASADWRSR
jgi:outer membrane protein TolC